MISSPGSDPDRAIYPFSKRSMATWISSVGHTTAVVPATGPALFPGRQVRRHRLAIANIPCTADVHIPIVQWPAQKHLRHQIQTSKQRSGARERVRLGHEIRRGRANPKQMGRGRVECDQADLVTPGTSTTQPRPGAKRAEASGPTNFSPASSPANALPLRCKSRLAGRGLVRRSGESMTHHNVDLPIHGFAS